MSNGNISSIIKYDQFYAITSSSAFRVEQIKNDRGEGNLLTAARLIWYKRVRRGNWMIKDIQCSPLGHLKDFIKQDFSIEVESFV